MSKALDQMKIISASPLNAETPTQALHEDLTPNELFYVRNHFDIPQLDPQSWSLEIISLDGSQRTFSLDQIQALPQRSQIVLLECAGNGRTHLDPLVAGTTWGDGAVAQAEFTGISLSSLLNEFDLPENVIEILFTGADSGKVRTGETTAYARSLVPQAALHPDVLLAWQMNGQPLPPEHGYPLRLLVPKAYGMASVKWLKRIEFLDKAFDGFFQTDDYVYKDSPDKEDGAQLEDMRVSSLFTSHPADASLKAGSHQFSGIAWSGQAEISEVALSIDEGTTWQPATLAAATGPYGWTRWKADLAFSAPGAHTILLRASDSGGAQQPSQQYWNKGGYGNNLVQRLPLTIT